MKLFCAKYKLKEEQVRAMLNDGVLSYRAINYSDIAEHYGEMFKYYRKTKAAVNDTMVHFRCSKSLVYLSMRIYNKNRKCRWVSA